MAVTPMTQALKRLSYFSAKLRVEILGFGRKTEFGGGKGVIGIGNVKEAPSVSPAKGGILFVEDGALKYRGSGGTVTVIASA